MSRRSILAASLLVCCAAILAVVLLTGKESVAKTVLVNASEGELPPDTGTDNTNPEIVDEFPELGGKALKVSFAKNDSFGGRLNGANRDWKRHRLFRFDAFNPA